MRHSKMTPTDGGVHTALAYVYPTEGDRLGAVGFTAEDVGKLALQESDNSVWMLVGIAPLWREISSGGASLVIGDVPFTATTTTLVLMAISVGQLVLFSQLAVLSAFGVGTVLQVGTFLDPSFFLRVDGSGVTTPGAYSNMEVHRVEVNDFLLLTVSAVGVSGNGRLFYEVR